MLYFEQVETGQRYGFPMLISVGEHELWADDTGTGPAVVLLHPGIHDSTVWEPVIPRLEGFRVIRYDRPGFGGSPVATSEFDNRTHLLGVLDALGVQRALFVGNSMGGALALTVALEDPERVESLVLLAPGIEGYPWPESDPEQLEIEAAYRKAAAGKDAEALADVMERAFCAGGVDESIRRQLVSSSQADFDQEGLEKREPEHWSRLGDLDVPTVVVVGGIDEPASTLAGTDLAERITGAELIRLNDADHLIPLRAPEVVADKIRKISRAG